MANDKNNVKELVVYYCQIAGRLLSGRTGNASPSPLAAASSGSPEIAPDQDLTDQIWHSDEYADQLRLLIRDLQATVAAQSEQLGEIEKDLEQKVGQLTEVTALLASANRTIPELHEKNRLTIERHNREILALQAQIENNDDSLSDTDIQNQELVQQLLKQRESTELLRAELQTREIKSEQRINSLINKYRKLARQNAEYKDQITAREKAVQALLTQFSPGSLPDENTPGSPSDENTPGSPSDEDVPDRDATIEVIDYSLYGSLRDELDEISSIEPNDISRAADEERKRELIGRIDGSRMCFSITKDKLTIGRTIENDIQLSPSYISRHHAVIVTKDGTTQIVDSGSKNGVFVNYKRVREHSLSNGDVVAVGFAKFVYREYSQADS